LSFLRAAAVLVCLACSCRRGEDADPAPPDVSLRAAGPTVDVRLAEAAAAAIVAPGDVEIAAAAGGEPLHSGPLPVGSDGRCLVTRLEDGLGIGGRKYPGQILVRPRGAPGEGSHLALEREGQAPPLRVRGGLLIQAEKGLVRVANRLTLEEYLAGVVGAEMAASAVPLEALKAQAVAARTYALATLERAAGQGRATTFAADASFQAYGGVEKEHRKVLAAVTATAGEVLRFRGRAFRAYFHSTCGGATSPASLVFQEPAIPPLEGAVCGACGGGRFARWETRLPAAEIEPALRGWAEEQRLTMGALAALEVGERTPDGRALSVRVVHASGRFTIEAARLRVLIGLRKEALLWSCAFEVERQGEDFVFAGRGWGHGVGLCQVGAARRAETQGYREVLAAYFPQSELARAY
jgi:stage II sporulation protein D